MGYLQRRYRIKHRRGVNDMQQLDFAELDDERIELLPARETLYFHSNWANVWASNSSTALNVASHYSFAHSAANQYVVVNQS
jgi:photosystem II stability/assembly factor-like uncharacterized protein